MGNNMRIKPSGAMAKKLSRKGPSTVGDLVSMLMRLPQDRLLAAYDTSDARRPQWVLCQYIEISHRRMVAIRISSLAKCTNCNGSGTVITDCNYNGCTHHEEHGDCACCLGKGKTNPGLCLEWHEVDGEQGDFCRLDTGHDSDHYDSETDTYWSLSTVV